MELFSAGLAMTVRLFTTLLLSSYLGQRKTQQHSAQTSAKAVWSSYAALASVAASSIMRIMNSAAVHGATWRWEATVASVNGCMCENTTRGTKSSCLVYLQSAMTIQLDKQLCKRIGKWFTSSIWSSSGKPERVFTLDTPVCQDFQDLGTDALNTPSNDLLMYIRLRSTQSALKLALLLLGLLRLSAAVPSRIRYACAHLSSTRGSPAPCIEPAAAAPCVPTQI
jgi:hypothetical protein